MANSGLDSSVSMVGCKLRDVPYDRAKAQSNQASGALTAMHAYACQHQHQLTHALDATGVCSPAGGADSHQQDVLPQYHVFSIHQPGQAFQVVNRQRQLQGVPPGPVHSLQGESSRARGV